MHFWTHCLYKADLINYSFLHVLHMLMSVVLIIEYVSLREPLKFPVKHGRVNKNSYQIN